MNEQRQALEKLLSAATGYVSSRLYFDSTYPGADDDASMELRQDFLDEAVLAYVKFL